MNVLFIIFEFQGDAWAGTQLTKEENKMPSISDGDEGTGGSWRWVGDMASKVIQQPRQPGSWVLSQGPGVSDSQSCRA